MDPAVATLRRAPQYRMSGEGLKVLHIQKVRGIGGSERHLLMLLPALRDAGVDVRMCVLLEGEGNLFVRAMRERGIEVRVHDAGPDLNPRLVWRLVREIRDYEPSIVHTHLVHADLHGRAAAAIARYPMISSVHGITGSPRAGLAGVLTRAVGWSIPRTIAISHFIRSSIESTRHRRRGTVTVIHYGIEVADWLATSDPRGAVRRSLGLAQDDVAVAITARLIDGKGHGALIDAIRLATASAPSLCLIVAGDGPLRGSSSVRRQSSPQPVCASSDSGTTCAVWFTPATSSLSRHSAGSERASG